MNPLGKITFEKQKLQGILNKMNTCKKVYTYKNHKVKIKLFKKNKDMGNEIRKMQYGQNMCAANQTCFERIMEL